MLDKVQWPFDMLRERALSTDEIKLTFQSGLLHFYTFYLLGPQARDFFLKSNLPVEVLSKIW